VALIDRPGKCQKYCTIKSKYDLKFLEKQANKPPMKFKHSIIKLQRFNYLFLQVIATIALREITGQDSLS